MHLQFYGAAGEVTGSCHIVSVQGRTLLLDCGLIQGGDDPDARNRAEFPFDAERIDAVVLSHAHIDHCGRLPLLHKRGYRGPIYATPACRDLARILLSDSAHMAERDAERINRRSERRVEPLFDLATATGTLEQFEAVPYGRPTEVLPGVVLTYHDAGHILGSASVRLDLQEGEVRRRLLFSGDVGQYDSPILRDPDGQGPADFVVMESTYGNRRHRERRETLEELGAILRAAAADGGNVLIPAFAVGRSQEVLYEFANHFDAWQLSGWRIFLDSPMAIEASQVYWRHADLFDEQARAVHQRSAQLPPLPNLSHCRTSEESMAVNRIEHGAIVIAGSGMCTGGRILHHLRYNLARPECDVVFTGFQAFGTLGRAIVDRRETVRIHREQVPVRAKVHTLGGFSAHGDQDDLLRWHSSVGGRPRTFLVHGEREASTGLCEALRARDVPAEVARPGLRIDLAAAL